MDASLTEPVVAGEGCGPGAEQGPTCHVCGYSRRGLPAQGLCPECGEAPSPRVTLSIAQATAALTLARTHADRAWLWSVGLGLVLLVVASFTAARVALVME